MEFIFRKATEQDIPEIMKWMHEAKNDTEHPDWFMSDEEPYVREHLEEKGFIIVAETLEKNVAGFFLIKYPELEDEAHLGKFLGYSREQLEHTAIMDSAVVGKPYRGHGLQRKMGQAAEAGIDPEKYQYLLCTIHPDNQYSLSNMQSQGYQVKADVLCYGGKRRYVLEKCLKDKM